jgi:hypothetical protein
MLDVLALQQQIQRMVQEQSATQAERQEQLDRAVTELQRQGTVWPEFAKRVAESRTSWLVAGVCQQVNARIPPPPCPHPHTVLATDGSQIFPDRHEGTACYLINIGRVVLPYGQPLRPLLDSQPTLFYRERDLYHVWNGRRTPVTEEVISLRRQWMEFEALAQLASELSRSSLPGVALSDGTLILWTLEGVPPDFRQEMLERFLISWERLRQCGWPLAGYISQPASADVINALRVGICPEVRVDCDKCPWKGGPGAREPGNRPNARGGRSVPPQQLDFYRYDAQMLPCAVIEGVTDAQLFAQVLAPGERSALFASVSQVLGHYGPHGVYFFYVHVGSEIGRVEVPAWVATCPESLERVHAVVVDQAEKGGGYPLALIEAHEKAVVRSPEREAFYRLVQDMLVQQGLPVSLSSKSWSKRIPRI